MAAKRYRLAMKQYCFAIRPSCFVTKPNCFATRRSRSATRPYCFATKRYRPATKRCRFVTRQNGFANSPNGYATKPDRSAAKPEGYSGRCVVGQRLPRGCLRGLARMMFLRLPALKKQHRHPGGWPTLNQIKMRAYYSPEADLSMPMKKRLRYSEGVMPK